MRNRLWIVPLLIAAIAVISPSSMGMGDVKLVAAAGALAGMADLQALLVVMALVGGMLGVLALVKVGRSGTLAYGPAIALGAVAVMLL